MTVIRPEGHEHPALRHDFSKPKSFGYLAITPRSGFLSADNTFRIWIVERSLQPGFILGGPISGQRNYGYG